MMAVGLYMLGTKQGTLPLFVEVSYGYDGL